MIENRSMQDKVPEKRPEDVIGFLREFNFGNRDEDARVIVERYKKHKQEGGDGDIDIAGALKEAGYLAPGQTEDQALEQALLDFEEYSPEKQIEVSKDHEDWRV